MNWEQLWSEQALQTAESPAGRLNALPSVGLPAYPIHGTFDVAKASTGWSKTALLSVGALGVIGGAILGDLGLVLFMRGFGGKA